MLRWYNQMARQRRRSILAPQSETIAPDIDNFIVSTGNNKVLAITIKFNLRHEYVMVIVTSKFISTFKVDGVRHQS